MDNQTDKLKPMGTQSKETMAAAEAKAREAVDSAGKTADRAIDKVADKMDHAKADASAAIDKVADKADNVVGVAKDRLHSASQQVRSQVANYSDQLADYTQNEPIKAMLIAAAAGALLIGLVSLMARSDD